MVISWWFTMVQSVIKSPTKKSKMSILHLKEQTQFHHESSEDFMTYIQHLLIPSFPKTNCWWTKNTACHANSRNSAFQLLEIGHIVHQTSQQMVVAFRCARFTRLTFQSHLGIPTTWALAVWFPAVPHQVMVGKNGTSIGVGVGTFRIQYQPNVG